MFVTFIPGSPTPDTLSLLQPDLPNDVDQALALALQLSHQATTLGEGGTRDLWETLATLASHDLGVARAIEPHLDAVAILTQAGRPLPEGTWGVFAAEGGPDPLRAIPAHDGWVLAGTKPWCSLAADLNAALVTARTSEGEPRLFAVDLAAPGVQAIDDAWQARGLVEIPSGPVAFSQVPAVEIGQPGWYLSRPGFWWGGIGVAACWFGGAVGIARTVFAGARRAENPHRLAHLGAIDTLLHACRLALADAAAKVDCGGDDVNGRLLARRVRGLVARSCEEIIIRAGHALGPGPLATDAVHAKRVADLQLYIRQHHAEADEASQGGLLAADEDMPW